MFDFGFDQYGNCLLRIQTVFTLEVDNYRDGACSFFCNIFPHHLP